MTEREKWLSVFLFYAGDWVFSNIQDIFTPQALAFPISLIIIGMVGRSYVVYAPSVELRRLRLRLARSKWLGLLWRSDPEEPTASPLPSMWRAGSWKPLLMLLIVFVPLVFTHPLSPFIIVLEVAALTIVNRVRPLWLFAILGAIAALYLTINETFLTNHHDAITGPKSIVQNAAPPTNVVTHIGPNHVVLPLITVALFGFAAIGALSRLYDRREVRVFAVLAIAPLMIVGLVHYGGETLYRALLFSTPWAACLGASAARPLTERAHSKRSVEGIGSAKALRMAATAAMIGVMTVMLLVVNDSQNELYQASGPDLSAAEWLYKQPPGVAIFLNSKFPARLGYRYNDFILEDLQDATLPAFNYESQAVLSISAYACQQRWGNEKSTYLILSKDEEQFDVDTGSEKAGFLPILERELIASSVWSLVFRNDTTMIFKGPSDCRSAAP